jgi:hypothetical protein
MNQNQDLLREFVEYCEQHPEQRFWQALRNWSDASFIFLKMPDESASRDTFYFTRKNS